MADMVGAIVTTGDIIAGMATGIGMIAAMVAADMIATEWIENRGGLLVRPNPPLKANIDGHLQPILQSEDRLSTRLVEQAYSDPHQENHSPDKFTLALSSAGNAAQLRPTAHLPMRIWRVPAKKLVL